MTESFQSQINNLWTVVPLDTVLISLESGKRPRGGVKDIKTGIPSLGGEHLNSDGGFKFENIRYIPEEFALNMLRGQIKQDDILIVKDGATTGKVSFVNRDFPYSNAVVNEHVFICRISKFIDPKFIFYFLFSETGQKRILENFKGSAQGGINSSFSAETLISLAPLKEQKRIVNKIEELLSELDHAVESFKKIQQQLKIYRQAVLKAAFEGKLTEEWKKFNSQNINLDPSRSFVEIKKLGDLIEEPKYGTSKKCSYENGNLGVLRIPNLVDYKIDLDDLKKAEFNESEKEAYSLKKGDLLIIRSNGSPSLVGTASIIDSHSSKCLFAGYLIRLRCLNSLNPNYLLYCLHSYSVRNQIELQSRSTSGVHNINSQEIKSLLIPYCSLEEQNQIIQEIESRLSICDELEKTIEQNLILEKSLRQSILKKAFEGKLVPQDPNDEPAELLLEKIKLEKEKLAKLTNSSKTKTKREKVTA
ncbi:MAG: restriction endonuclease subunit S [Cyanobacteria bacterium REEB446]|nr:restriction endonuclease subunit S [Cyanobacteria bacterium REEB446]